MPPPHKIRRESHSVLTLNFLKKSDFTMIKRTLEICGEIEKMVFQQTITRNLSFDRWKAKNAQKRGNGIMDTTLDELAECIPAAHNTEEAVEAAELERSINAFLHTLSEQECNVFLRRYWFVEEYAEIAGRYGMNLNTVKTSLFRTRKKLQKYLEQQGIVL